ncbi:alpha/beta hydrolase fold domain-containing protein [Saccharopolyspora griseoalba]|uniref:Alpha/beta hydrolase fold domain-containing protein n=1 Tax=Saccharopolyspora griseoalba TaxID=1431848 RepID=A0ABW2LU68_9PSEU
MHADIAYAGGGGPGHLLDIHPSATSGPSPLLVVTGGSAWMAENGKDYGAALAPFFTARGHVVAGVSVRASSTARFPAQVHDIKAAIRWLRAHAGDHGIDPHRVAVLGDSSGGWAATMAAVTGDRPEFEGALGHPGESSAVQAAVDLYGPTDFLRMDAHTLDPAPFNEMLGITGGHDDARSPESRLIGGPVQELPEAAKAANPITYLERSTPPVLIAHGRQDPLVPHHQSELLFAALRDAGADAVFYSVPGVGHDKAITAADTPRAEVSWTGRCDEVGDRPSLEVIDAFLRSAFARS